MKIKKILNNSRGKLDIEWLRARFSFSFANWYNPEKMGFGALRVLNNDIILGGRGFPAHSHQNMEIITIPLKGSVSHKDSTGADGIINTGEIQIMSAGSGITHSEFNASQKESLELFQIWILPDRADLEPRYDQKKFELNERKNKWQSIVAPNPEKFTNLKQKPLKIYQNAYLYLIDVEDGKDIEYNLNDTNNGVYLMIIEGEVFIDDTQFIYRDAAEITNTKAFTIKAKSQSQLLVIEVIMK